MTREYRVPRIEGDIAYIALTQGYEAIIDAADVPLVGIWNWRALSRNGQAYAVRSCARGDQGRQDLVLMHRVIMGAPAGMTVDHRDGNGLNNRRENLRLATHAENAHNQRKRRDNSSGFKGVSWHKDCKRWQAYIAVNGKRKYLGLFGNPADASEAYSRASVDLHGEFGRTE